MEITMETTPANFLSSEEVLNALIEELQTIKSASENLAEASQIAISAAQSADQIAQFSTQLMQNNSRQYERFYEMSDTLTSHLVNVGKAQLDIVGLIQEQRLETKTYMGLIFDWQKRMDKITYWLLGLVGAAVVLGITSVVMSFILLSWVMIR